MTGAEIAESLIPPRQFEQATLENYQPDPDYPSQARAVERVRAFAASWTALARPVRASGRPRPSPACTSTAGSASARPTCSRRSGSSRPVAPTSARSSSTRRSSAPSGTPRRSSCSAGRRFIAIDEFELDDPGDTMMMTRLLGELASRRHPHRRDLEHPAQRARRGPVRGRRTSCARSRRSPTGSRSCDRRPRLPAPRCREPRGRARRCAVRRGRHRGRRARCRHRGPVRRHPEAPRDGAPVALRASSSTAWPRSASRACACCTIRPMRCDSSHWSTGSTTSRCACWRPGVPLDQVFGDDMLAGGYRKKYLRAISRLIALTSPEASLGQPPQRRAVRARMAVRTPPITAATIDPASTASVPSAAIASSSR